MNKPMPNTARKLTLDRGFPSLPLRPALLMRVGPSQPISAKDWFLNITGVDLNRCPGCHQGSMILVGDLPAIRSRPRWDSS